MCVGGGRDAAMARRAASLSQHLRGRQRGRPARLGSVVAAVGWGFSSPGGLSGDRPAGRSVGEAEGEESAQVDCRDPVVEPVVVPGHASVAESPVASGQPGDGAFDHGPVLPVGVLETFVGGPLTVLALQQIMLVELHGAALRGGGAQGPQNACGARLLEHCSAALGEGAGHAGRAGQGACGRVVGEVVDGEPAPDDACW